MRPTHTRHRNGLTLIELFVVVGIIAILVGILIPTVNGAKKAANTTACLAKLRATGQTCNVYVSENRQSLPYLFWYAGGATPDLRWHGFWQGIFASHGLPPGGFGVPVPRRRRDSVLASARPPESAAARFFCHLTNTSPPDPAVLPVETSVRILLPLRLKDHNRSVHESGS